ncbi:hypothetical protein D1631_06630 [Chryseobacterium nematophagum]|uniref:Uncharacterized protein n=1 Tax=Chryseobacterium nematophagum TaxID=2305228 RepID=A0A3M7TF68_9FLAO|nr:hypothetical protein [Chryseobacterium nematophagum]RNA61626.1 hypothetical protein D1631_06630 [Chryseobacterium nematophagum]
MAEELYFIKTNPIIAKINLYNKLCREEKNITTFLDDDKITSLEIIKNKVKDSEIEQLTKEELLHIFSWFNSEYPSDNDEMKTQLFINGIDLFYEIPSPNHIKNFQQILSDYENLSEEKIKYILNSDTFNQFIIYGIFFTGMIQKEKKGNEQILSDFLKPDHKSLYSMAETKFNSQSPSLEVDDIIFQNFTDLYDLTKFYKGKIIQLHDH